MKKKRAEMEDSSIRRMAKGGTGIELVAKRQKDKPAFRQNGRKRIVAE